jgi:FAD:protein FMN transferase
MQELLQGSTMGTTYTIRYLPETGCTLKEELHQRIDEELRRVNQQMSTYIKDSEVTRFNESTSTDWFPVSRETAEIVNLSLELSEASEGAFDVTVGPLVNLWGFGPHKKRDSIPSEEELRTARARVGYKQLYARLDPPAIKKTNAELQIDLSAIAKGHGSDRVGALIQSNGISNYFVEIGGEIIVSGKRADGNPWRIGIEAPLDFQRSIHTTLDLSDAAIATSGDYRNFFEVDGKRFSHTIDPNTGRPVLHQLASSSVIANNCALADGIATCMMALGEERGLELAESKSWAVLLLVRKDGRFPARCSTRFLELFPEVSKQLNVAE